jgi:hypothetical protein
MFRTIAIGVILLIAAGGIAAAVFFVTGTGRYQLTVRVDYEGTSYVGQTVWEVSVSGAPELLPAPAVATFIVRGEAVDIPLGDGRTLFVLMRERGSISSSAFGGTSYTSCLPGTTIREKAASLSSFRGTCDLNLEPWIVIADGTGALETVDYKNGASAARVTVVSTIALGTDKPIGADLLDRHGWIRGLPSNQPYASFDKIYRQDFIRR